MLDPPRDDSKVTLDRLKQLGLSVKMLTGDQQKIAVEMASRLGLGTNIVSCAHVNDASPLTADRVESSNGFAEVFPAHKHSVVTLLQNQGHLVGMTGDGVNDAPALKQANVGIAVAGRC